jgi:2-polyprenyl-3-methyl-5-hydroxy-6-metoxy-1,4-benzoquinol methylase
MRYKEYEPKYFEKPKHSEFSPVKRMLVNIISITPIVSLYYYNIVKIIRTMPKNGKVLDIGCSHGGFLNFVHNIRPDLRLYGTDISNVQKLLPSFVKFIKKDIINDNIREKDFDFVHSRHLIEHLAVSDVNIFFKKCRNLLKKRGVCFVLCPRISKEFFNDPTHIRPYNKESISRFFSMSGFSDIKAYDGYEYNLPIGMKLAFGFARK